MIDGPWACTTGDNPEQFMFYDNGQDADCCIVAFASKPAMRLLAGADTWFVDGNFAMAPRGFLQLYVIRVPLGNTAVSTVYMLYCNGRRNSAIRSSSRLLGIIVRHWSFQHQHPRQYCAISNCLAVIRARFFVCFLPVSTPELS